jgi:hypothetical protein
MRRTVFLLLVSSFLVFATSLSPATAQGWFPEPQKRLTIGGTLVDALADFQRHGGQVDEILTPDDLAGKPPLIYGIQNGRSVFAISGGSNGGLAGLITVDGSSVEASMTPDGFLELKADQTGVRNRNMNLYRALFPDQDLSQYTTEAVFEYIDESGKRFIFGGSEDGKTTAFLFKKDSTTGELVYKIRRDIARNKEAKVGWVEPDESSTFPVRFKICDSNRDNCVVRNIIKKPGDELRINPTTQAIKLTFNKDTLPYSHKYGNAQRLKWACKYRGEGFYFTYREGYMGGDPRRPRTGQYIGNLSCDKNVLTCARTGPGQKCNFDFRDYLDDPMTELLFGINWLTSRLDRHRQHFTISLDPNLDADHLRVTKFENIGHVRTLRPLTRPASPGNDPSSRLYHTFRSTLCPDARGGCPGAPAFAALEVTGVGKGTTLIDERTNVKLKNLTHATLYVLRNDYGTGKRGDFVGAVVDNRGGGTVISTLLNRNDQPRAPDLLDKKDHIQPDNVQAILAEMKREEEAEEIQRTALSARQRALVLFPARHGWGFASKRARGRKVASGRSPAKVMIMAAAEARQPARRVVAASPQARPTVASRYASAASAPSRRNLSRPYAASAEPAISSTVKPPRAYSRPALYARRGARSPYAAVGSRTSARGSSLPRAQFASSTSPGPAGPPPPYRTASAAVTPTTTTPRSAPSSVRRRVPLRMPLREEGPRGAVPAARQAAALRPGNASPSEPAPSLEAVAPPPAVEAQPIEAEPAPAVVKAPPKPTPRVRTERLKSRTASPVRVTRAMVREVQRRLKRQGYPIGKVDGSLGRQTARAIRRFQRDVSLQPTGSIDRWLMASLGMEADNGWSKKSVARTARVRKPRRAERWKVTKTHIKEVQRRLALIGYRPGSADGVYGRQTARAVKRFQRQVGLKPTGRIDKKVLHRLSIKP